MEDLISDLSTLKVCKRALEDDIDSKYVIEVLDTVIMLKELQFTKYEKLMEIEHGISNT